MALYERWGRFCDRCGLNDNVIDENWENAIASAVKAGWKFMKTSGKLYCCDCVKKTKKRS